GQRGRDHRNQPYLEGRALFHPSRSRAVPQSYRARSRASADVSRRLLVPWQPDRAVCSGRERSATVPCTADRETDPHIPANKLTTSDGIWLVTLSHSGQSKSCHVESLACRNLALHDGQMLPLMRRRLSRD